MIKIIVYGYDTCKDCVDAIAQLKAYNADYKYMEFSESTANLKRFLKLRDSNPVFDKARQEGKIGIPCFLLSDGIVTLDLQEVLSKITKAE